MKSILLKITLISLLFILFIPKLTSAESKTFIKEYTYQASEVDSKVSCRAIALEQLKRLLLEELGTYLESETEIKNYQLSKDQISALTAGIVQAQVLNEKWDGQRYWMQAKIKADPDDVLKAVDSLRKDREKSKELDGARKRTEEVLREVERLRKDLESAKEDKTKTAKYDEAIKELSAMDFYRKGLSYSRAKLYKDAIDAYTTAIGLDPKFPEAYISRGFAHYNIGKSAEAIEDYGKTIEIDPQNVRAYIRRGLQYSDLDKISNAIQDYSKAIELDPKNATAYNNRGAAYSKYKWVGSRYSEKIISDYSMAIQLNPKFATAYNNRGNTYSKIGEKEKAMNDYKAAARLGNKSAQKLLKGKGIDWW